MSRWKYFLQRLVLTVPILLLAMSIVFLIVRAGPLDPARAIVGMGNPAGYHDVAVDLGIERAVRVDGEVRYVDVPLWQQYVDFMAGLLTLDLGQSWVIYPETSVYEVIALRAPRTLWLGFWSVLIALFVGIPLGFYAGLNPNTWGDYTASFGGIVWRAMPNFWLAVILVAVLSNSQQLFGFSWQQLVVPTNVVTAPNLGFLTDPGMFLSDPGRAFNQLLGATKQILPAAIVLGSSSMGNEMRIGRTAVLETINSNYVETARAKGVSARSIVWKHVFRNALIPLIPIITAEAFLLIGGSVIVEYIFAINGLGQLFFTAATKGDLPLVGSLAFIFILLTLSLNVLQDFLYTIIDPRVGYEEN
ncbi:ABC transporter permease [Halobacteria archaeon HArc-gm2]|nr:ABC transporter permease [Halobacteria archaeon HArc-gm2]